MPMPRARSAASAADVGGLVGYNLRRHDHQRLCDRCGHGCNSGMVRSCRRAGGRINSSGTITDAYATGAVTGGGNSGDVGGLVGENYAAARSAMPMPPARSAAPTPTPRSAGWWGPIIAARSPMPMPPARSAAPAPPPSSAGWWGAIRRHDHQRLLGYPDQRHHGHDPGCRQCLQRGRRHRSDDSATAGHTADLGFDSSVWGTGDGLYPYFLWQYPTTPQAVSGFAYGGGGTALAYSTSGTDTVSVDAGGALVGQTNISSANGYYYVLMAGGTIANGDDLVVSLPTDAATGAVNAATLATSTYTAGTPGRAASISMAASCRK